MTTLASFVTIGTIRGLTAVSQLIIIAVASRVFDKATFGRFAIAMAGARLLASLSGLGANSYLLKDVPFRQERQLGWHSYQSTFLFFVVAPLAICTIAGFATEWLSTLNSTYYPLQPGEGVAVAALGFLWANMLTLGAYVRVTRSSTEAMIASELTVPATLVIALGATSWTDQGNVAEVLVLAGACLATIQLVMLLWHMRIRWIPIGGRRSEHISLRELTAYWGTVLLNTMTGQLDVVLAGTIISPVTVGLYMIIKRLSNMMTIASSIVVWMLAPQISRATAAEDSRALQQLARKAMHLTIIPAILIAAALAATVPWWTAYFDVARTPTFYLLLSMMLGGTLVSMAIGTTIMFATQTGMPGSVVRALSLALLIAVPVMLTAGTQIGILGVALGQLVLILMMKLPVHRAILHRHGFDISIFNLIRGR